MRSATFLADPEFIAGVSGGGSLSAEDAVAVYARGYVARLTEALGETYEACWRVLGDKRFFAAAADYIRRNPSCSYNLSDYGQDFLRCQAFDSFDFPFLEDLAAFEWEFKELFHTAPHAGLEPAELARRAKPDSRFRFGSAVKLLSLKNKVYAIWKRDRADDTSLEPSEWEGEEYLAFYKREGNSIFVRQLEPSEFRVLEALRSGRSLSDALEAGNPTPEAAQSLFTLISEASLVAEVF